MLPFCAYLSAVLCHSRYLCFVLFLRKTREKGGDRSRKDSIKNYPTSPIRLMLSFPTRQAMAILVLMASFSALPVKSHPAFIPCSKPGPFWCQSDSAVTLFLLLIPCFGEAGRVLTCVPLMQEGHSG